MFFELRSRASFILLQSTRSSQVGAFLAVVVLFCRLLIVSVHKQSYYQSAFSSMLVNTLLRINMPPQRLRLSRCSLCWSVDILASFRTVSIMVFSPSPACSTTQLEELASETNSDKIRHQNQIQLTQHSLTYQTWPIRIQDHPMTTTKNLLDRLGRARANIVRIRRRRSPPQVASKSRLSGPRSKENSGSGSEGAEMVSIRHRTIVGGLGTQIIKTQRRVMAAEREVNRLRERSARMKQQSRRKG